MRRDLVIHFGTSIEHCRAEEDDIRVVEPRFGGSDGSDGGDAGDESGWA
jgi:hypothetical protein